MTQCEQILHVLQTKGSITGMESYEMGIMNYKGRINDLRKLGFKIQTKMVTKVNAQGQKKTFAVYTL